MNSKKVRLSVRGERVEVKCWGVKELPGLSLVSLNTLQTALGDTEALASKQHAVIVHDASGKAISLLSGGVKHCGKVLDAWRGGGVDWTEAEPSSKHLESISALRFLSQTI